MESNLLDTFKKWVVVCKRVAPRPISHWLNRWCPKCWHLGECGAVPGMAGRQGNLEQGHCRGAQVAGVESVVQLNISGLTAPSRWVSSWCVRVHDVCHLLCVKLLLCYKYNFIFMILACYLLNLYWFVLEFCNLNKFLKICEIIRNKNIFFVLKMWKFSICVTTYKLLYK